MPNVKFNLVDPGEMKAIVSITMTVNEWRQLAEQLGMSHPSFQLATAIRSVVGQATKSFYEEHKADS